MSGRMKNDLPPTLAHDRYSLWDGGRIVVVSVAGNTANTVWTCAGPRGIGSLLGFIPSLTTFRRRGFMDRDPTQLQSEINQLIKKQLDTLGVCRE